MPLKRSTRNSNNTSINTSNTATNSTNENTSNNVAGKKESSAKQKNDPYYTWW